MRDKRVMFKMSVVYYNTIYLLCQDLEFKIGALYKKWLVKQLISNLNIEIFLLIIKAKTFIYLKTPLKIYALSKYSFILPLLNLLNC